jgi:uncharacterized damage-inducible protein DinB
MARPLLADAFDHHVWATLRLIDACLALPPDQLGTTVPGTYGSIMDTIRHLVGADRSYLAFLSDGRLPRIDEDDLDLDQLRAVMADNGPVWTWLLEQDLDPDTLLVRRWDDGSETHAPLGIRLVQVVHHGSDHRSQVCTALTTLGVEPPDIDVWAFGVADGRVVETSPAQG